MERQYRGRDGKMVDALVFVRQQLESLQYVGKPEADWDLPAARTPRAIKSTSAAARVAAYMETKLLTQAQFAFDAGIGERTLRSLLHSGSASPRTWAEVARAIGTTPDDLLEETGH